MILKIGNQAPDFTAPTDGNGSLSLSELRGKKVILYFYPKDNTSGCTAESCDFRDNLNRLLSTGAVVIGVSPDSVKSHDKFKKDHELNFPLVSDEDKKIVSDYGVWVEKSMYGRKYEGVERSTFIIDENGVLRHIFRKVSVTGHVDEVLQILGTL